jgi:putative ABC transport system ATP-binding protein
MSSKELFASGEAHIRLESVSKQYSTAVGVTAVLSGIDLEVHPGESVAIMGRSGCGKTTLLNLLGGIDHATSGRILYNATDINKLSERELEKHRLHKAGIVFQLFNLIPTLSALKNVELPMVLAGKDPEYRKARAQELLTLMGIGHKSSNLPDEMSGGEQQRVAISIALANDAPLILADEPTGNLDSKSSDIVTELLCSLAKKYRKTVLIVSHDPHIPRWVDRTLVMEDGKLQSSVAPLKSVVS